MLGCGPGVWLVALSPNLEGYEHKGSPTPPWSSEGSRRLQFPVGSRGLVAQWADKAVPTAPNCSSLGRGTPQPPPVQHPQAWPLLAASGSN